MSSNDSPRLLIACHDPLVRDRALGIFADYAPRVAIASPSPIADLIVTDQPPTADTMVRFPQPTALLRLAASDAACSAAVAFDRQNQSTCCTLSVDTTPAELLRTAQLLIETVRLHCQLQQHQEQTSNWRSRRPPIH